MAKNKPYDFIIGGGGASGLSLAYYLSTSYDEQTSIAIIEPSTKDVNDRTWCFWGEVPAPFERIISEKWDHIAFLSNHFETTGRLSDTSYSMIKGIDFYNFVHSHFKYQSNVFIIHDKVKNVETCDDKVDVQTENTGTIEGNFYFNSFNLPDKSQANYFLLQHFKGWVIESEDANFDPNSATLMDFRVEQEDEVRFFYVLPFSKNKALIEFTVFSEKLKDQNIYDDFLRKYISDQLKINQYHLKEEEFGVIPMTDLSIEFRASSRVFNIGTAGGAVKASTGYAFKNILHSSQEIAAAFKNNTMYEVDNKKRLRFYDQLLLNILQENGQAGKLIFTQLFAKNSVNHILKFMDEKSCFFEELRILSTLPKRPFVEALLAHMRLNRTNKFFSETMSDYGKIS